MGVLFALQNTKKLNVLSRLDNLTLNVLHKFDIHQKRAPGQKGAPQTLHSVTLFNG